MVPRSIRRRRISAAEPFVEHEHRDLRAGSARAAVFGISDGLQTNIALMLGVAGAHPAGGVVRLAGLAGLIGGAFSMAAGEYVSVRAHTELLQRELAVERAAIARTPEAERRELVARYLSRGVDDATATRMAAYIMSDPEFALETHAREELGIDPGSLASPTHVAVASFLSFAIGAFIPLVPWLIAAGTGALLVSLALAGVTALIVGASLARFTGRSMLFSALRQVAIAGAAAGVTFGIGHLVGVGTR